MNEINTAIAAAKAAGKIVKDHFMKEHVINNKDDIGHDIVTDADFLSEKTIVSIIKENFSNHNILSEETSFEKTDSLYTWIIDPIDGTDNFARGIPLIMVGIALKKGDEVVLAVCYDPIHDELFRAEKGKGAYCNNKRIRVSERDLLHASVARAIKMSEQSWWFEQQLQGKVSKLPKYTCALQSICFVAAGKIDGAIVKGLNAWDFAPALLVKEAGGQITALDGSAFSTEKDNCLVTNGKIHKELLALVNKK